MRALLLILLAAASLPLVAQTVEPGQWEFASTLTSPGLPRPHSATITQCISPEDAADPTRFTARNQAEGCEVTPGSRTGDSYTWTVVCAKQGLRGAGKLRFGGATIESEMQMTMDQGGQKMEMLSKTSGRRLGPCTSK